MTQAETLQHVLEKYKFEQPIPFGIQKELMAVKKSTLAAILKKQGRYGLFVMTVISLFFQAKKLGMSISVMKCIIAAAFVSVFAAGTVTAGAYYLVSTVLERLRPSGIPTVQVEGVYPSGKASLSRDAAAVSHPVDYLILPFEHGVHDGDLARKLSEIITEEMKRLRNGTGIAAAGPGDSGKNGRNMVFGSLVRMEKNYQLTVRVAETRTSRISLYLSETIAPEDTISKTGKLIAARIIAGAK